MDRMGNFIFIGRFLWKAIDDIEENDLRSFVKLFDDLMPVYEYVETNFPTYKMRTSGERISRICWNDKGWIQPSGKYGKSTESSTHERKYGYGHEEWLGDISKIIDGYHYSFLESIRGNQESLSGKIFNIDLFTINGISRKRYLIGNIQNLEIIDPEVSQSVKIIYKEKGWLDEMEKQIVVAGANSDGFSEWAKLDLFNVRFRPDDLHLFADYLPTDDKQIDRIQRYTFVHKTGPIKFATPVNKPFSFQFNIEETIKENKNEVETATYERDARPIEIFYLHKKIRNDLKKWLIHEYGDTVSKENPTGQGTLIDLVRVDGDKRIFYEIKTYNNTESLHSGGNRQLFEYAFWPGY